MCQVSQFYRTDKKMTPKPNQTLHQTAEALGVPLETLLAFLQAASAMVIQAEATRTAELIGRLPRIIEP